MAINKVIYGDDTLIDLTNDTVAAAAMLSGYTAHDASGAAISGQIVSKSSNDIGIAGPTVSIPSGYYVSAVSTAIASGAISIDSKTVNLSVGYVSLNSNSGLISVLGNRTTTEIEGRVSTSGYLQQGTTATNSLIINQTSTSYQLSTQSAVIYTPSTTTQTIPSGVYLTGVQTIEGDANLIAANIAEGVSIFGIVGSHHGGGNLQSKTVTPSSSSQVVTYDSGYDGLSSVTVEAISISVVNHRLILPDGLIGV